MLSAFSSILAQNSVTVTITADNAYVFGFGDKYKIINYYAPGVCNTSAGEIYNSAGGTESYTITGSVFGGYIYIASWADKSKYQGLIAQFSDGNTTIVTSPNPSNTAPDVRWEVYATGIDLDISSTGTNPPYGNANCPTLNDLNQHITIANNNTGGLGTSKGWVKDPSANNSGKVGVLAFGPYNMGVPGNFPPLTAQGIQQTAQWMWYYGSSSIPSLSAPFTAPPPPGEFYIFRIGPINELFGSNTCCPEYNNLVVNPGFDQPLAPNTTSQYHLHSTPPMHKGFLPGEYLLLNGAQAVSICNEWNVQDHSVCPNTSDNTSGHFMIVNGETTQPSNIDNIIWQQTINKIEKDSQYRFCMYLKNLPQCCFDVLPKVKVEITPGGSVPWTTINKNATDPCDWQLIDLNFKAISTAVTIKIYLEETTKGDGNDLAMDDISLNKISPAPKQYALFSVEPYNVTSTSYNVSATWPPLNFGDDCSNWWQICEVDANNNCIQGTEVTNLQAWWNQNPQTFGGYTFDLKKKYRITYGIWCLCYSWNQYSVLLEPGKGRINKPVINEDKNFKLTAEKINKITNQF